MKIRVVGNCQSQGVAMCMQAMLPLHDVTFQQVHSTSALTPLAEFDVVYVQLHLAEGAKAQGARDIRLIPRITFPAFHPDQIYVEADGTRVRTLMGASHSALTVQAWLSDLTIDQTESLFCRPVFERLGYLDFWNLSERALIGEGRAVGIDFERILKRWNAQCFMHTREHPKIQLLGDIALEVFRRDGLTVATERPADIVPDIVLDLGAWPVYPEIAQVLGVAGSYTFKVDRRACPKDRPFRVLDLREFITQTFEVYAKYRKESIRHSRMSDAKYRDILNSTRQPKRSKTANPYSGLPTHQFWRRSIAGIAPAEVDPVVRPAFLITAEQKVATAGSCFAQHIARELQSAGFTYFIAEQPPATYNQEEEKRLNFGVFSARYGNLYTARQLDQLLYRAYSDDLLSHITWQRSDGAFVDPFRPEIEPDGFATIDAMLASRRHHLDAVRSMVEQMDVFVFTLGLTEAWRRKSDGYVLPLAPGVVAGTMDDGEYEFVNFDANEIEADLRSAIGKIRAVNPGCAVILTVSPVPLVATYENCHVLVSTTYSKSALRVAAERIAKTVEKAAYFPSFEIITGNYNRGAYFEDDLRSVTAEGVAHVMRLFLKHYAIREPENAQEHEIKDLIEIVCEEELLDKAVA